MYLSTSFSLASPYHIATMTKQLITMIIDPSILEKYISSPKKNISTKNENNTSVYYIGAIIDALSSVNVRENKNYPKNPLIAMIIMLITSYSFTTNESFGKIISHTPLARTVTKCAYNKS
jgi:hypothetical protein